MLTYQSKFGTIYTSISTMNIELKQKEINMKKHEFEAIPQNERFNCTLEGTAYWASLHTPNMSAVKKFNADPFYGLKLALTPEGVAKAKSLGLKLKEADETIPSPFVEFKNKVKPGKDIKKIKPAVVDTMQNAIPETILIGNGSKVICKFMTYWNEFGAGSVGAHLSKVQVKDLVEFKRDSQDKDLIQDGSGFVVETKVVADSADDVFVSDANSVSSIFDD